MKGEMLFVYAVVAVILTSCSDGEDKAREELKHRFFNYKLSVHGGVDFALLDEVWADRNLNHLVTPHDIGRAINEELQQENSQFKWCEIALGKEEYQMQFAERLCMLAGECEKESRLRLCQIGLAGATILDFDIGLRGLSEYSELVILQRHEDEILKSCLDQLIDGRSICEIELPLYED